MSRPAIQIEMEAGTPSIQNMGPGGFGRALSSPQPSLKPSSDQGSMSTSSFRLIDALRSADAMRCLGDQHPQSPISMPRRAPNAPPGRVRSASCCRRPLSPPTSSKHQRSQQQKIRATSADLFTSAITISTSNKMDTGSAAPRSKMSVEEATSAAVEKSTPSVVRLAKPIILSASDTEKLLMKDQRVLGHARAARAMLKKHSPKKNFE